MDPQQDRFGPPPPAVSARLGGPLEARLLLTRRHFFGRSAAGIGTVALASLLNTNLFAGSRDEPRPEGGLAGLPHFRPKARRVIYLFQSGAPSQMDLFDYKPGLAQLRGSELPA